MVIPYDTDAPIHRRPYANFVIPGLMCVVFAGQLFWARGTFAPYHS